jgi:hypothetical protein
MSACVGEELGSTAERGASAGGSNQGKYIQNKYKQKQASIGTTHALQGSVIARELRMAGG